MSLYTKVCLVMFGYFFPSIIVQNNCIKLDGYKFPVYSTPFCPRNESEWNNRSSVLNCNRTNGYTCLPNEKFTELLEFCYTQPWIWVQEGFCLYLKTKGSYVDAYSCSHFIDGCHNTSYQSRRIFNYPACITIGNGCFLAEQSCKSSPNADLRPETPKNDKDDWLWIVIVIIVFISCISPFMLYFYCKKRKYPSCKRGTDKEGTLIELEERNSLITNTKDEKDSSNKNELEEDESFITKAETGEKNSSCNESRMEKYIFDQWKQEDLCFISTNACKEVEKMIESKNLVTVAGHSGSGKSAIIQHIALKYREQGWTVRRVKKVENIADECSSSQFQKNKTICVFNDPFGKESFDEILSNAWQIYDEELKLYLKTAKLVMACRNHIIYDTRLALNFVNQSHIVDIDDSKNKLSFDEKRQILKKYTSDMNLSDKECEKIVEVERYFPLLCKLYSYKENYKQKGFEFFTEPVTVLKEEIVEFRKKDKNKYCALALLVLFHNDLCVSGLLKDKDTENKFKHTLKLCGLPDNTAPSAIGDYLNSLKGCFVKTIGDTYQFYHDFVMEVTTHVFGTDYPVEIIKYADTGFLRKRVRLGDFKEHNDPFTIYPSEIYIEELGERLFTELFREHVLDVVLNPCLRNEKVIKVMKEKIAGHPKNIHKFLKRRKITIDKQEHDQTSNHYLLTKLSFLDLENQISPLFVLIVFCHTKLSQYCLNSLLQQMQTDVSFVSPSFRNYFTEFLQIDHFSCYFSAACCNGSIQLFNNVFKDQAKDYLSKTWGILFPIHIVSVFHNYQLLNEMIDMGVDVNLKIKGKGGWTSLILAAGNDTQEYGDYYHEESGEKRRDKTVQLLLSNGAGINLCLEDGASPLFIACENGHYSTVQLLLSNGANINLCMNDGTSPLYIACHKVHDNTVELLLSNGADVNLRKVNGMNPIYLASERGQNTTLKLLLRHNPNINFICSATGASPLHIACQSGHDDTVQLLLDRKADINLCITDEVSPLYIAFAWRQYTTVNILLERGADTSICSGLHPTYLDLSDRNDSTIEFLLRRDNINNNIYDPDSYFSLFVFSHVERMSRALFKEGPLQAWSLF